MFIGAIVFFYMGISRKVNTVMHVLTFFIAAVSACAYYAEWAGLGEIHRRSTNSSELSALKLRGTRLSPVLD